MILDQNIEKGQNRFRSAIKSEAMSLQNLAKKMTGNQTFRKRKGHLITFLFTCILIIQYMYFRRPRVFHYRSLSFENLTAMRDVGLNAMRTKHETSQVLHLSVRDCQVFVQSDPIY